MTFWVPSRLGATAAVLCNSHAGKEAAVGQFPSRDRPSFTSFRPAILLAFLCAGFLRLAV